jgi:hypothetical protein
MDGYSKLYRKIDNFLKTTVNNRKYFLKDKVIPTIGHCKTFQ